MEGMSRVFVRGVIEKLGVALQPAQLSRTERPLTSDAVAYQQYLMGRYFAARRDTPSLRNSEKYLREAVAHDRSFAAAYAALATSLFHLSQRDGVDHAEKMAEASEASARALELDSGLAEAHVVLALKAQYWDWDWKASEEHFRQAVGLRPRLASAHHNYAKMLYPQGRLQEALGEIDEAYRLDPFDRSVQIARGEILMLLGRVDDAIRQQRMVISADPAHANAYVQIACSYEAKGLLREAVEAAERAAGLTGRDSFALAQLGHAYAVSGRHRDASLVLEDLLRAFAAGKASACEIATVYAGWHDVQNTLEWLGRGIPARDPVLTVLKVDPMFDFLRGEPRFRALLAQVHLD
jgi:serine/threonine-protein kinase